jgi:imidazolonepropionase-like amidohydrolase
LSAKPDQPMNEPIVLTDALLIDGNGADPRPNTSVQVSGDKILAVCPHSDGADLPGKRIDLGGRAVLPGLIDAHVHPGNVELYLHLTAQLPPAVYVHRVTRILETDLQLGFTTLRDAAGLDAGFRTAIDEGLINGPRLLLCVTPLTLGDPGDKPDPRNSLGIAPEVCRHPDDMRRAVTRTLARGADHIKVFADGEVVSQSSTDTSRPGQPKFTVASLRAAVEAAEEGGAYVMAHAYGPAAVQNCIRAGIRSIEHGNLMDDDTIAMMVEHGTYYVPTLSPFDEVSIEKEKDKFDRRTLEKLELVRYRGKAVFEKAWRAGVTIASGSDILGPDQSGKGRELVLKASVMGAHNAIVAATRTNAELLGLSDRIGTIEAGKQADLIVVDGNPVEDITLLANGREKVVLVMKDGRIVKDRMS